jgi:hypothetical protein
MVEDPDAPKRGKRVQLPYEGPPLHELWVTTVAAMDRDKSSTELEYGSCQVLIAGLVRCLSERLAC